jgi:hypothetical protein
MKKLDFVIPAKAGIHFCSGKTDTCKAQWALQEVSAQCLDRPRLGGRGDLVSGHHLTGIVN